LLNNLKWRNLAESRTDPHMNWLPFKNRHTFVLIPTLGHSLTDQIPLSRTHFRHYRFF